MFSRQPEIKQQTFIGGIIAFVTLGIYAWAYQFSPFSDTTNLWILNIITIGCAASAAIGLTLVTTYFQKGELPRVIWASFAIGIWCWVAGEVIWSWYNIRYGEVPDFTPADIVWSLGYVFLTISIVRQYFVIYPTKQNTIRLTAAGVWIVTLAITYLITKLNPETVGMEAYLAIFYPLGDFWIGAAAVILVIIFQRGLLARPWLSLLVFVVSDSLYIWATTTGLYGFGLENDLISMGVDMAYILAYLVLGWGVFQQYFLLMQSKKLMDEIEAT